MEEKTITINGEKYVRETDYMQRDANNWEHVCVIATNGWIFEGWKDTENPNDKGVQLESANVVREWSNGLGIGGLADAAHKDDYTLDKIGDILIYADKVIAEIPLGW